MSSRTFVFLLFVLLSLSSLVLGQGQPPSDPKALAFAAQSITALTGGTSISDVTLTGNATWMPGDDGESGAVTLMALGTGESRIDISLPSGTRTEIRDASSGTGQGQWTAQSGTTGKFAGHNCLTDAAWFFPALGSLAGGANTVLSYIGQETRNGASVQHIQSYVYFAGQGKGSGLNQQQLSTMNFYLDATTLLPSAITFNVHPDTDANTNIAAEIDLSNYQVTNGVAVPMHIQKYLQGDLLIDVTVSSAAFNTGLTLSNFTIN